MRLIDADALIKEFDPNGERLDPILVRSRIVQQPTAYDVKKVVKELEKEKEIVKEYEKYHYSVRLDKAIDIVKRGVVE